MELEEPLEAHPNPTNSYQGVRYVKGPASIGVAFAVLQRQPLLRVR
jgi:hypothetical protein